MARSSSRGTPSRPSLGKGLCNGGICKKYGCCLPSRYSKKASMCIARIHRCMSLVSLHGVVDNESDVMKELKETASYEVTAMIEEQCAVPV
jgi:hypothetical protein